MTFVLKRSFIYDRLQLQLQSVHFQSLCQKPSAAGWSGSVHPTHISLICAFLKHRLMERKESRIINPIGRDKTGPRLPNKSQGAVAYLWPVTADQVLRRCWWWFMACSGVTCRLEHEYRRGDLWATLSQLQRNASIMPGRRQLVGSLVGRWVGC